MIDELIQNHIDYAHALAADLASKYPGLSHVQIWRALPNWDWSGGP
jgi:hypothetical protein